MPARRLMGKAGTKVPALRGRKIGWGFQAIARKAQAVFTRRVGI